jgi:hypothetical protein
MNTTGFLRGYMAKNMSSERFINIVAEVIAKEFDEKVQVISETLNEHSILFKGYRVNVNSNLIDQLKGKSPYAVDRLLLSEFRKQGFTFDDKRSQYLMYCFMC